jgi:hypothetical protein
MGVFLSGLVFKIDPILRGKRLHELFLGYGAVLFFFILLFFRKKWQIIPGSNLNKAILMTLYNALWESGAKLLILLGLWRWLSRRLSLVVALWAGAMYGTGEALILSAFVLFPGLDRVFNLNFFLVFITWGFFLERCWCIAIHGIISGILWMGLKFLLEEKRPVSFLGFSGFAVAYHFGIDLIIILVAYGSRLKGFFPPPHLFYPIAMIVGVGFLLIFGNAGSVRNRNDIIVAE